MKSRPGAAALRTLIAFDPGVRDAGLACFTDRVLTGAWWVRAEADAVVCPRCGTPCPHTAAPAQRHAVIAEARRRLEGRVPAPAALVVEWPVVYKHQLAPAADLIEVAGVAAGLAAVAEQHGLRVLQVTPRDWKGGGAKDLFQCEILAHLTDAELSHVPRAPQTRRYEGDAVDAVGLGLWALQRLHRKWVRMPQEFAELVEPVKPRKPKVKNTKETAR